ncbi:MAG: hypothetical protein F8N15_03225 [Methanobacterium sp.]|nr:hypothetical protein [Methanobacterium sp.]
MKPETDNFNLKKRLENIHDDIDPMKAEKFRLSEINYNYVQKELLTPNFMEKHTKFRNFSEMIRSSDLKIENEIEFKDAIETEKWNRLVRENSNFKDWNEMLRTAVIERATRKLAI